MNIGKNKQIIHSNKLIKLSIYLKQLKHR